MQWKISTLHTHFTSQLRRLLLQRTKFAKMIILDFLIDEMIKETLKRDIKT